MRILLIMLSVMILSSCGMPEIDDIGQLIEDETQKIENLVKVQLYPSNWICTDKTTGMEACHIDDDMILYLTYTSGMEETYNLMINEDMSIKTDDAYVVITYDVITDSLKLSLYNMEYVFVRLSE